MMPTLLSGQKVLVQKKCFFCAISNNDIVIMHNKNSRRVMIKRVVNQRIRNKKKEYYIVGDNAEESTDSRTFGWVEESLLIGKVI
jgi:type IV secretory pathway protease TraF